MDIEELKSIIEKTVNLSYEKLQNNSPKEPQFLTRIEAAQLMNVCLSTLDKWSRQGKLEKHFLGKIVRYKKSEILQSLETLSKYQRS